jgi:hypothetical protein
LVEAADAALQLFPGRPPLADFAAHLADLLRRRIPTAAFACGNFLDHRFSSFLRALVAGAEVKTQKQSRTIGLIRRGGTLAGVCAIDASSIHVVILTLWPAGIA